MGRRNNGGGREQHGGGWDPEYWDYSGWQRDRRPAGPKAPKAPSETWSFPTVDDMKVKKKENKPATVNENTSMATAAGSLARSVQKALNQVRKHEAKMRKNASDASELQEKWDMYQQELQQIFVKERQRFKEKIRHLEDDKKDIQENLDYALAELQAVFMEDEDTKDAPAPKIEEEAQDAWDALIAGADEQPEISKILESALAAKSQLQQATKAQMLEILKKHRDKQKAEETGPQAKKEPGRSSKDKGSPTPGSYAAPSEPPPPEPYLLSPSTRSNARGHTLSRSRPKGSLRMPVKTVGRAPTPTPLGGTPLAEKLARRRKAEQSHAEAMAIDTSDEETKGFFGLSLHLILLGWQALLARTEAGPAAPYFSSTSVTEAFPACPPQLPVLHPSPMIGIPAKSHLSFVKVTLLVFLVSLMTWKGGHVQDIIGALLLLYDKIEHIFQKYCQWLEQLARAWLVTIEAIGLASLASFATVAALRHGRTRHRLYLGGTAGRLCRVYICVMVWRPTSAVQTTAPRPTFMSGRPLGVEQWAAEQQSRWERLVSAHDHVVRCSPLYHSEGSSPPPQFTVRPPGAAAMQLVPDEFQLGQRHISTWVATPFFEPEVVDIQVRFPMTLDFLEEALRDSLGLLPDYASELYPTTPQLDDHFASFVAVPGWIELTDREVIVIDARPIGGTVYPVYHEGPLTRQTVQQHLIDIQAPSRRSLDPVMGGVIQVRGTEATPVWSDSILNRLGQIERWNPTVQPPGLHAGLFSVYQSAEDQVIQAVDEIDDRPLEVAAEEALDLEHGTCWVRLPEPKIARLTHAGRAIWEQVAVLDGVEQHDRDARVIFLDLRGLGLFPQWLQLGGDVFRPEEYVEGLQLQDYPEWTLMVVGGEPIPEGGLRVMPCEVLTMFLQKPETDPVDQPTDDDFDNGPEDPDSDYDDDDLMSPSGDEQVPPPQPGDPPRGPPPPEPVNRSRSPRGRNREGTTHSTAETTLANYAQEPVAPTTLSLADVLPPPVFDIAQESLALPHTQQDIAELMKAWEPNWLDYDTSALALTDATRTGLQDLIHWSQALGMADAKHPLRVHLYTDGSFSHRPGRSGAGLVILIEIGILLSLFGILGEPILGASPCPWGPSEAPALQAEQAAIIMALLWLGQSLHFLQASEYVLHFDCQAAGWSADGTFACCNPLAVRTRHLESYLQEVTNHRLKFTYVRAHDAHAWNDLADTVAKAAASQTGTLLGPPHNVIEHFLRLDLSWAAASLYGDRHGSLPVLTAQRLQWDPGHQTAVSPLRPDELIPVQIPSAGPPGRARRLQIQATSINIQGIKGKYKYLSDQLAQACYQTVFFQEIKDSEGLCRTGDYLRLHTASHSHWGVGIWLNRRTGFATIAGQPVTAEEADIHILHSDPRLLMIAVRKFQKRFILFSGHCPHTGRPQERDVFLRLLQGLLEKVGEAYIVLGGLALNGRPPPNFSFVTGDLQQGEPDEAGAQLVQCCQHTGLWIPATFGDIHVGTTTTYVHPRGDEHRLDFVLVGGQHHSTEARSWTDLDIDTGNRQEDHRAVSLQLRGHFDGARDTPRLPRPRYDRQRMLSEEGKAVLTQAYRDYAPPPWETHVDVHCQHFQGYIADVLNKHFLPPKQGPRASFIPPQVWAWRELKLSLKKRTAYRKDLWKTLLQAAFARWAGDITVDLAPAARIDGLLYEITATAIGIATAKIKREIYQAKDKFLKGLIAEGAHGTADFLRKMKQHGIGGRKARSSFKPLPRLLQPDGQPVVDRSAQDVLWLTHFGKQELGEVISTTDFLRQETGKCAGIEEVEWTIAGLPTVEQVESVLRAAPRGKAPGIDGLPGEAFAAAPQALGLAMHSLVTKCMLECLQQTLHSLHLGSRRNSPIQFASLYLLSIFRRGARRKISTGALFLDTRSAYYRVAREVATGPIRDDYTIARIFKHFELDGEDIHDLYDIIRAGGLLTEAGTPSMLNAAVRDIHHRTWAISSCSTGQNVASSMAGSRPGESFADAIFAFVYGRVLGQIAEILDGEGVLSYGSYDPSNGILGNGAAGDSHLLRDATWADDSSFPLQDECPHRLVRKAARASSVVLSRCSSFGMSPNLAPGKTALVLALRGRGSQKARREHFSQDGKTLLLRRP
ncbi:unnamed protein product [Symbiodinium sp. CCMP2592]|nr:unnamed protein product [Symbiodinium sp. CCMP2592]